MLRTIAQIIFERLKAQITDSVTVGLAGVKVWHEEKPQDQPDTYVTFSVDTSLASSGSAPIYELTIEAYCYASTANAVGLLGEAVYAALVDYVAVLNGVYMAGLSSSGSQREYDAETRTWVLNLRWQGLAIG